MFSSQRSSTENPSLPISKSGIAVHGRRFMSKESQRRIQATLQKPTLIDRETGLALIVSKGASHVSSELQSNIEEAISRRKGLVSQGAALSSQEEPISMESSF